MRLALVAPALFVFAAPAAAQVSLTTLGSAYTQNFNGGATAGLTSVAGSTVPAGWAFLESGSNATLLYDAGDGSSAGSNTWSYGAALSADRAFGTLRDGGSTFNTTFGAAFANGTGATVTRLDISYTGELWRRGAANRAERLDFQYSLDATSLNTGTWVDANGLDFNTVQGTVTGALDGNSTTAAVAGSVTGLNLTAGGTVWVRWNDLAVGGAQDGMAVDNFSLTPVPEPAAVGLAAVAGLVAVRSARRRPRG